MKTRTRFVVGCAALAIPMLAMYASPAKAEYEIQIVSPPGAVSTQVFGLNNAGIVTGVADDGTSAVSFTFDIKSGTYATIANSDDFDALEISNSGVMVGDMGELCAIRDRMGNITTFPPPSNAPDSACQARGVNSMGKVSGFEIDSTGMFTGFIYDTRTATYETFLPAPINLAVGLDERGRLAGNVFRFPDEVFPGSPAGNYGYIRRADGGFKFIVIDVDIGVISTRPRSITESGNIAGWYLDLSDSGFALVAKSFIVPDTGGVGYEQITLTDDQILYASPCDPNVPAAPGPGYELVTDFFAAQTRNDGVVVGTCRDTYVDFGTGDFVIYSNGFVATPVK